MHAFLRHPCSIIHCIEPKTYPAHMHAKVNLPLLFWFKYLNRNRSLIQPFPVWFNLRILAAMLIIMEIKGKSVVRWIDRSWCCSVRAWNATLMFNSLLFCAIQKRSLKTLIENGDKLALMKVTDATRLSCTIIFDIAYPLECTYSNKCCSFWLLCPACLPFAVRAHRVHRVPRRTQRASPRVM